MAGLSFGSFVNALVWRIRELESTSSKKKRKVLSPISGRSMCPRCKHELGPLDLLPVLSWVFLRGKCKYCKKPISWQYPLVELIGAVVFVASYLFWPVTLVGTLWIAFIVWLAIITVLLALAIYDLRWMELPDSLVVVLSVFSVIFVLVQFAVQAISVSELISSMFSAGLLFAVFYILFQVSKGRWIGGGDVKLAPALGLLAGSLASVALVVFIASLIGSIIGIPLLIFKKQKHQIKLPFGPLLIIGLLVVFFYGNNIINWYMLRVLSL